MYLRSFETKQGIVEPKTFQADILSKALVEVNVLDVVLYSVWVCGLKVSVH